MYKRFLNYALMGICTVGVSGLYSCVDNAYDLNKEIDKTITVGGDMTLPESSTEEMKLADILDLEDNSAVKTDGNGNYSLVQTGESSDTEVKVNSVNIPESSLQFRPKSFNIDFPNSGIGTKVEGEIPSDRATIDIDVNKEDIDQDILDIFMAYTKKEIYTVSLTTNDLSNSFEIVNGFQIQFPDYMTIGTDETNYYEVRKDASGNENILYVKKDMPFVNGKVDIDFYIKSVNFDKPGADFTMSNGDGKVYKFDREKKYITDENGNKVDETVVETLKGKITMGDIIKMTGNVSCEGNISGEVEFSTGIDCKNMDIESVKAVVDPNISIEIDPIRIENLPDFLSDNEVELDLTDPRIFITLSNGSPLPAVMSATLISEKDGVEGEAVHINDIEVPGNCTDYKICIHQNENMDIEGMDKKQVYIVENLNEIIRKIPDMVKMKDIVTKAKKDLIKVNLGEVFNINTDYEVNTPLMFGGDTKIIYNETMDGFSKDLDKAEFSHVEVMMKALNKIPLNLELTADALDKDGNILEGVTVSVEGNIAACSGNTATEKDLSFVIKATEGDRVRNLDGLKINIKGSGSDSSSNVQMNENQSLKLEDVKLKLIGGVTMDLN